MVLSDVDTPAFLELRQQRAWVCWRMEEKKGRYTKVPYAPATGQFARSDDPATWSSYDQARSTWLRQPDYYSGLGYMFHQDYTGIDVDHCINADGQIEPWAQFVIDLLDSYTEVSPSGSGVHIFVHGHVLKGTRRRIPASWSPQQEGSALEMYSERRYFTITGHHLPGSPVTINERQSELDLLYQQLTDGDGARLFEQQHSQEGEKRHSETMVLSDQDLLQKASDASNGGRFRALFYSGSTAGYVSASEADLALCLHLAFWTGKDTNRMDALFHQSALYRDKWNSARGESTYGAETLQKAIALCTSTYDPERSRKHLEQDIDQMLQEIEQQQTRAPSRKKRVHYQLQPHEVKTEMVLEYLSENEYGDARFFVHVFQGQVCYDHSSKEWYLWCGHFWQADTTGRVRQLVSGVLGGLYLNTAATLTETQAELDRELEVMPATEKERKERLQEQRARLSNQVGELCKRAKDLRSAKRMQNTLSFVQTLAGITSERWDTNPWLLATPNGVIDLKTGECRPGDPDDYIRTVAPTEWTGSDTRCPRFEQFLYEIFSDKPEREDLIQFVQRLLGYGITGETSHHVFPILYGEEGRNGKDTLIGTLKNVLGSLVGAVSNDVFLQEKKHSSGAATPHLCDLQGKRLVWGSETKEGDRFNVGQVKQLTGGGEISARQLHGRQYTFTPTHKLLLMTNYKPHADARDKAFWSRACLIEFGMRFVDHPRAENERNVDPGLKDRLKEEESGILAWLVRGCLAWQEQGLNIPPVVQQATERYQKQEDNLHLFIEECCLVQPEVSVKASEIFTAYKNWSLDNQFGKGMNARLFGEEMSKRFVKTRSNAGRIYQGIGLLTE